jgi:hypothetical protein
MLYKITLILFHMLKFGHKVMELKEFNMVKKIKIIASLSISIYMTQIN